MKRKKPVEDTPENRAMLRADYDSGMTWKKLHDKYVWSSNKISEVCRDLIDERAKQNAGNHPLVAARRARAQKKQATPVASQHVDHKSPSKNFVIAYRLNGSGEEHFKIVDANDLADEYLRIKLLNSAVEVRVGELVEPKINVTFEAAAAA